MASPRGIGPCLWFDHEAEAVSFVITCKDQKEADHYSEKLSVGGDLEAQQCGWLKDQYGVSWQVVPEVLMEMIGDLNSEKSDRAMEVVLQMKKIDGDHRDSRTARVAARGGFGTACSAIEGMLRTLAAEVGPRGVRVAWLRSAGSPESFGPEVGADSDGQPSGLSDGDYLGAIREATLLKRFPRLAEVGEAAALIASDRASAMTGAAANITCGQVVD